METCTNCTKEIKVAIFKGTGHCSENCRKALEKAANALVAAACERFHPGEPCKLGQNHPAVGRYTVAMVS